AAFAIQLLLQAIKPGSWPTNAAAVLCPLIMGYFLAWCRESEITADRGGFLCCPDRKLAERAILRQFCKLDQRTVEKYGGTFDPDSILNAFEYWENKPFVDFLRKVKGLTLSCPYVDERIAALRVWTASNAPDRILGRKAAEAKRQYFEIDSIKLTNLADRDKTENPYVAVYNWETVRFKIVVAS